MSTRLPTKLKATNRQPSVPSRTTGSFAAAKTATFSLQQALESPGQPLDATTRLLMESRFGHDFSQVRVHTDEKAAASARELNATAFTINQDIFFAAGRYQPQTPQGLWLLAHELTHTLQQRSRLGVISPQPLVNIQNPSSSPPDSLEQEAASAADRVVYGQSVPQQLISVASPRAQGVIARQSATLAAGKTAPQIVDPAQLIEFLTNTILTGLQTDSEDRTGKVRRQIAQMTATTREAVLDRLQDRMPRSQWQQLNDILAQPVPSGENTLDSTEATTTETNTQAETPETPEPETVTPEATPTLETAPTAAPTPTAEPTTQQPTQQAPEQPEIQAESTAETETTTEAAPTTTESTPAAASVPEAAPTAGGEDAVNMGPVEELEAKVAAANPEPEQTPSVTEAAAFTEGVAEPVSAAGEAPSPSEAEVSAPTSDEATPDTETEAMSGVGSTPETEATSGAESTPDTQTEATSGAESTPDTQTTPAPSSAEFTPDTEAEAPTLSPTDTPEASASEATPETETVEPTNPEAAPDNHQSCPPDTEASAGGEMTEAGGEGGTGGGGGGSAITEQPAPAAPDLSQSDPVAAMAAASNLPVTQLQTAIGGVGAAASRSVGEQRTELAANPPQQQRPSGAPAGQQGSATPPTVPASPPTPQRLERIPQGQTVSPTAPAPLPAAPTLPTLTEPRVTGNAQQQLSEADVQQVQAAVRSLPTTDPALDVEVGTAPTISLEGNADPAIAVEQRDRLNIATQTAQTQAQQDAAQPMGENQIYPHVPEETLTAEVGTGGEAGAAGATVTPTTGDETAAIIAEEKSGDEVRASVTQAQGDMVAQRQEHETRVTQERANAQNQIDAEIQHNADEQTAQRTAAQQAVQQHRQDWQQEQRTLVERSRTDANAAGQEGTQEIDRHQQEGNTQAATHVREGNSKIVTARQDAQRQALQERRSAESETGGILGWLASRIRSFFEAVKRRIQAAFEAARRAVRAAIETAQRLAAQAIERARQAIVDAIRWVGDRLVEIGDILLAGFPELRDRFRRAIQDLVKDAIDAVNRLAEQLKQNVQQFLNLLGQGLDAALGLLERGLLAAVDFVNQAIQSAIQSARAFIQGLAVFAGLIRDIAANPGQWLSNLGAAIVNGIRNHLWQALKTAVKEWFNSKVEGLLGLGSLIQILIRGCISFAQIARMAWQAVLSAIPMMVIQLLIEKLVSLLVPAAAAVTLIIQGLQAAWGAASQIITAINAFVAFLLAVKTGSAAPQFANLLATGAVAVIDFIANFLLTRLAGGLRGVGQRLRGIAQRLQRVVGAARRGATAVARGLRTAGRAVVRVVTRAGRAIARTRVGRFLVRGLQAGGRAIGRGYRAAQRQMQRLRDRWRQWQQRRRQNQQRNAREQLQNAIRELQPKINALLTKGVSGVRLRGQLLVWRIQYRLKRLYINRKDTNNVEIRAKVNPDDTVKTIPMPSGEVLRNLIHEVVADILKRPDVQLVADWMQTATPQQPSKDAEPSRSNPTEVPGGLGILASVERNRREIQASEQKYMNVPPGQQIPGVHRYSNILPEATTYEGQRDPRLPNAKVVNVGTYPEIARDLNQIMGQTGLNDKQMARVMRDIVQTGTLPEVLDYRAPQFNALAQLVFVRESVRNSMTVATAPMTMMLIEKGEMTWHEAFAQYEGDPNRAGGRGAFPVSMKDAEKASRELNEQHGRRTVRTENAQELARREMELAERWLKTEMLSEGLRAFNSTTHAKEFIRDKILQYYGIIHRKKH